MVRAHPAHRRRPQRARRLRAPPCARQRNAALAFYVLATPSSRSSCCSSTGRCCRSSSSSFQGPNGGLTFPMRGVSLHWFGALFGQAADRRLRRLASSARCSLALLVMVLTLVISRPRRALPSAAASPGATLDLLHRPSRAWSCPGSFVGFGIGARCSRFLGLTPTGALTGLGAHLTWTLPFGLLIMFAVLQPLQPRLRGGRARPRRLRWRTLSAGRPADRCARA